MVQPTQKQRGKIKEYNAQTGTGVIVTESGVRVRFQKAVIVGMPEVGVEVEFEAKNQNHILEATKVMMRQSPQRNEHRGQGRGDYNQTDPVRLPQGTVFMDGFYEGEGENRRLRMKLFFEAAKELAQCFQKAELKSTQFRILYQGFLSFAAPLRDRRISFEKAQERFGVFYAERVVRQVNRSRGGQIIMPEVVQQFFDEHRDVILRSPEEMLGMFRYLTNVYCYFKESEDDQRR